MFVEGPNGTEPCRQPPRLTIRSGLQMLPRSKAVPSSKCETNSVTPSNLDTHQGQSSIERFREIQAYVTSQSKHLIAACQDIFSKLESTEAPGYDEKSFAELKRILTQRIQDLQNCGAIPPCIAKPAKTANNADWFTSSRPNRRLTRIWREFKGTVCGPMPKDVRPPLAEREWRTSRL